MTLLEHLVTPAQVLISKAHNPSVLKTNHSVSTGLGLAGGRQEADAEKHCASVVSDLLAADGG